MNWQDFFKLTVSQTDKKGSKIFFEAKLKTPREFAMQDLIMTRFDHLHLGQIEKKKLSLDIRKIILCHDLFETQQFKKIFRDFNAKIQASNEKKLTFFTEGGGIYLFLHLMKNTELNNKKIICFSSEIPLPIISPNKHPAIQFIYRPHGQTYLSDFPTLWRESDLISIFELKDYKASA